MNCPHCNGKGSVKATGYMPRAAICTDCDGSGEVEECPMCHDECPAPYLEDQLGGLCQTCIDDLRDEGWDEDQIADYKGEY